uniref:Uncharacterized protein n=1 Tax=Plectus sambesii TaxID=2011161 RepID=A0A914W2C3_9BILA
MINQPTLAAGLACLLLLQSAIRLSEACAATVTTPETTCPGAEKLLATNDGTTFEVSNTGAQPFGTTVSAFCGPETGDRWIRTLFDNGAVGYEDERFNGGESLVLECQPNGSWQTTTFQYLTPTVTKTTGTLSNPDCIQSYQKGPFANVLKLIIDLSALHTLQFLPSDTHPVHIKFIPADADDVSHRPSEEDCELSYSRKADAPIWPDEKPQGRARTLHYSCQQGICKKAGPLTFHHAKIKTSRTSFFAPDANHLRSSSRRRKSSVKKSTWKKKDVATSFPSATRVG